MVLAILAAVFPQSVSAGKNRLTIRSLNPVPIPEDGNQCSLIEKTIISTRPIQKPGAAASISVNTMDTLSNSEYCFMAEAMPTGKPITMASTIAAEARMMVLGSRSIINSVTGSSLR